MGIMAYQDVLERYPDSMRADGFDKAIIGACEVTGNLIYSITKCINILVKKHGMDLFDAEEYFSYNVSGAYMGEGTPIYCDDKY